MKVVYIAGPYMGVNPNNYASHIPIERNILAAKEAMITLIRHEVGAFCPHTHTHGFERIMPDVSMSFWYELDLRLLRACDAILRLPGFSKGADAEVDASAALGLPVFYDIGHVLDWAGQE